MKRARSSGNMDDIQRALTDLARLYPYGELQVSANAASFLQVIVEDVMTLRLAVATAVAKAEKLEIPPPRVVAMWRDTSAFLKDKE